MILKTTTILLVTLAVQALTTRIFVRSRGPLLASTLALRPQLAACRRQPERPALKNRDRPFCSLLSRFLPRRSSALSFAAPTELRTACRAWTPRVVTTIPMP